MRGFRRAFSWNFHGYSKPRARLLRAIKKVEARTQGNTSWPNPPLDRTDHSRKEGPTNWRERFTVSSRTRLLATQWKGFGRQFSRFFCASRLHRLRPETWPRANCLRNVFTFRSRRVIIKFSFRSALSQLGHLISTTNRSSIEKMKKNTKREEANGGIFLFLFPNFGFVSRRRQRFSLNLICFAAFYQFFFAFWQSRKQNFSLVSSAST